MYVSNDVMILGYFLEAKRGLRDKKIAKNTAISQGHLLTYLLHGAESFLRS